MKKLISLALCAVLASSMTVMTAFAAQNDKVVQVNVMDGLCTLVDNAATNHQASNYALCFAEAYGTGRTTEDDAVFWENVTFEKDVKQVAIKCGYNLGGDKAGTSTQFWLYLDKIDGEPIAKVEVSDAETASSQIKDQVLKFADVDIKAGTYKVFVVGKTEYSGSVSQINFMYNKMDAATLAPIADTLRQADLDKLAARAAVKANIVQVNVLDGACTLIDNAATNHQASNYALCFAEAYGTGRTTEDDAVVWEEVKFDKAVKQLAVKCGYNLGGDKAGTGTEFWVYLNKIEGEPIAKVAVNDSETASSQIKDQVYKTADVEIEAGTYKVFVVGKTEYSGSVSQINFMYEPVDVASEDFLLAAAAKRTTDVEKAAKVVAKRLEEEKKAREEAKKAEEEEKNADEEAKSAEEAAKAEEEAAAAEEEAAVEEAPVEETEEKAGLPVLPIAIGAVVVIAVIAIAVVLGKKKK